MRQEMNDWITGTPFWRYSTREVSAMSAGFVLIVFANWAVIGALLLVSLILSAFLAALSTLILQAVPVLQVILTFMDVTVSLPVITVLFVLMFKVLPDGYIAWMDVWRGALATGTLFLIGKWVIGLYLGSPAMASMYGAASSLMIILAGCTIPPCFLLGRRIDLRVRARVWLA